MAIVQWVQQVFALENPVDTPDYIKAKEERDHRLKRYGLLIAADATLVGAAIKIFLK